jgi:hypothetical protein
MLIPLVALSWFSRKYIKVGTPSALHNSRYMTALSLYDEWHESTTDSDCMPFRGWLMQRLNAEEPHCT